jgi:diguanylate cyclase (GGDEF)-like protein
VAARILLVERIERSGASAAEALSAAGYAVETARSGVEQIELSESHLPELIVLAADADVGASCRALFARPLARLVPVLVLTRAGSESHAEALDAGAVDVIAGDAEPAVLLARARSALRAGASMREMECVRAELDAAVSDLSRVSAQLVQANEVARYEATHDRVTGLLNRDAFSENLSHAIDHAQRYGHLLAVLVVDLDRFKLVNDSLGHERGNELLRSVAERLMGIVRRTDSVSRLASDEFAVTLVHVRERVHAGIVASKLARTLGEAHRVGGEALVVNPSIGIALYPTDGTDAETLLHNADIAMGVAKRSRRNAFQFFEARMNGASGESLMIENGLRDAAERGELLLHYQPQIESVSGEVFGAEALVRWRHPERGLMPPGTFLPVAESSGLIVPIGEWVVREAIRQRSKWNAEGIPAFPISVNASLPQLEAPDFAAKVSLALREARVDGRQIHFELTESCLTEDVNQVAFQLGNLRRLGIAIHIDDFGTGYSSLSKLGQFPIDTLKIDRSFVRDIDRQDRHASIAKAVVAMAAGLGFETIAEGVETHAELVALQRLGCTRVQGFLYSPPLAPEAFVEWLHKRERQD